MRQSLNGVILLAGSQVAFALHLREGEEVTSFAVTVRKPDGSISHYKPRRPR